MNVESQRSQSLWTEIKREKAPPLTADIRTKVLVIGAGITGLSTAYELARQGIEVVVVDRGPIGGGMSSRTSAHLSFEIDDFYYALIDVHGEDKARQYFESQKAAVDRVEEISAEERIACDFKRLDLFVFAPDKKGRDELEKEMEAAPKIGFSGVNWAEAPVAGRTKGALRFPNQARFHPLKYLNGLIRAIKRNGGQLYANTIVESVDENERGIVAKTANGLTIRASACVAATNSPFINRLAVHTKQAPYRTYVITLELGKAPGFDALMWDTEDPYHYVRTYEDENGHLLIVGGEDHKSGKHDDGDERIHRLEAWARERFPRAGKLRHSWSGQIYEPVDYAPFIGLSPGAKRSYIVTGDSGEGLTTGVAASLILPDLIAGRKNRWAGIYRPNRKVVEPHSLGTYMKDAAGAATRLVKRLLPGEADPEDLGREEGAIVTMDGNKVAAYRDGRGKLYALSAACTHVGCVVGWNSFERCWDCPCHGSQFAVTGEALQAPAVAPLERVEQKKDQKTGRRRPTGRDIRLTGEGARSAARVLRSTGRTA
jgi:glycine/D-amino acid oxidase-like deaminating enzyme/nitrite reductase/ring-hydroxylating ferredoxin subunit